MPGCFVHIDLYEVRRSATTRPTHTRNQTPGISLKCRGGGTALRTSGIPTAFESKRRNFPRRRR
ncbi:hypothetical protein K443DRAFT_684268 [Laccaria amethystina LaAM-08-1]|uniref:Uncharacterized protein n=1 Tax=Laccaria amethystina LaAM-08-1 TaxID=1095629 RepID=A0A0C9X7X5_9AGAR|nr:hypothetical protein K443DRAFT_684268 [Laccaria amethystina LaAM-08-1]